MLYEYIVTSFTASHGFLFEYTSSDTIIAIQDCVWFLFVWPVSFHPLTLRFWILFVTEE